MRHLLSDWHPVSKRLRSSPTIALFLDFDGTLARLHPRPEQVSLDGSMRGTLAVLARSPHFRIWVVSGRRQADVRSRVGVSGIRYLGLHGWEGRGRALPEETRRCLPALSHRLNTCLRGLAGVWIEDKQYAFSIHYRGVAPGNVRRAGTIVERIVAPCSERFRIQQGKSVWEVLPRDLSDKGEAVRQELASLRGPSTAVYLGDDQTDEPAFAALRSGITVRVGGPARSRAKYRLGGVAEVRTFLHKLRAEFA